MNTSIRSLIDMLRYRRPHGSVSERKFIGRYIDSVSGMQADKFGNRYLKIGDSATMISCHTDTVHTDAGYQIPVFDTRLGIVALGTPDKAKEPVPMSKRAMKRSRRYGDRFAQKAIAKPSVKSYRNCLGSDDCAGIWLALNMIAANVPAFYVFHREEECGGNGSDWVSRFNPSFVDGIERCIALDRRGQTDIITHQMMGRCCSDNFAWELADMLDMGNSMKHSPCPYGSFTDSANYTELIPECTNVSVGYQFEHTARESQDTEYLQLLADRLCSIDFEKLPTERETWQVYDFDIDEKANDSWKYRFDDKADIPPIDVEITKIEEEIHSYRQSAYLDDTCGGLCSAREETETGFLNVVSCVDCGKDLTIGEIADYDDMCESCAVLWSYVINPKP